MNVILLMSHYVNKGSLQSFFLVHLIILVTGFGGAVCESCPLLVAFVMLQLARIGFFLLVVEASTVLPVVSLDLIDILLASIMLRLIKLRQRANKQAVPVDPIESADDVV